jgi:hypothetical protein
MTMEAKTLLNGLKVAADEAALAERARVVAWLRWQSSAGLFFAERIEAGAHLPAPDGGE